MVGVGLVVALVLEPALVVQQGLLQALGVIREIVVREFAALCVSLTPLRVYEAEVPRAQEVVLLVHDVVVGHAGFAAGDADGVGHIFRLPEGRPLEGPYLGFVDGC